MKPKNVLVVAALFAAATYALLSVGVVAGWTWLKLADSWTLRQFHGFGVDRPGWVGVWRVITDVLSPTALRVVALAAVVAALIRRNIRVAVFLVLTIGTMGLVTVAAKAVGDRPRPETALTFVSSTAFPSGHALGMAVGVLALITVLWPHLTAAARGPVVAVGLALIVAAGLARVVLNVHHPSDVLAGWALGFLYYLLCVTLVHPWTDERRSRTQDSDLVSPG